MIVYGWRLYGMTDHVPGFFYVVTRFLHVFFFPVFPVNSYLVVYPRDPNSEVRTVKLGIDLRSSLKGYLRALTITPGVFFILVGLGSTRTTGTNPSNESTANAGLYLPFILGVASIVAFVLLGRRRRPGTDRAIELAALAGIPQDEVLAVLLEQEALRTPTGN